MTSQVKLTWTDYSLDESGFNVYRSTSPIDKENLPSPLATGLAADTLTYTDTTAVDDTDYYYAVGAANDNEVQSRWVATYGPVRSAPSWKPAGVDIYADFVNDQYWDQITKTLSQNIPDQRPSALLMLDSNGDWVSKAATVAGAPSMARENGVGLQTVPTRTNSVRNNTMAGVVAGTPGTLPTNWQVSIGAGLTRTVVGSGTFKGLTYVDLRFNGTPSTGSIEIKYDGHAGAIAATASQAWANTVFAQLVAGSFANVTNHLIIYNEYSAGPTYLRTKTIQQGAAMISGTWGRYGGPATTGASTTIVEPLLLFTVTIGQPIDFTVRIAAPQMEAGDYQSNPILTTSGAVTRTGNSTGMLTLPSSFSAGIAGFIKLDIQDSGTNAERFFSMTGVGFTGTEQIRISYNAGRMRLVSSSGGVSNLDLDLGAWTLGQQTVAFAVGPNYGMGRIVGVAAPTEDTSVNYPTTIESLGIGSSGSGANWVNCVVKKLALRRGAVNTTVFNDMYALAAAA